MSSSKLEQIRAKAAAAGEVKDQTEATEYVQRVIPAGATVGRFLEYIELGNQPQPDYKGQAKDPAPMVRLTFELTHPKNTREVENEDKTKSVFYDRISFNIKMSDNNKSGYYKLLTKMLYGRDGIKHMASMLGEAFLITVIHNKSDDKKITYANIKTSEAEGSEWKIGAPTIHDPLSGETKNIPVPEGSGEYKYFEFANPSKEDWADLFIDGTRTVKRKDESGSTIEVEESKNWLQNLIQSATNFSGSGVEALLTGLGELPTSDAEMATQPSENPGDGLSDLDIPADPAGEVDLKKVEEKVQADPAKEQQSEEDALAALMG